MEPDCRVHWGSHGCKYRRGHPIAIPHACECCECTDHAAQHEANGCVGRYPYYGPSTRFYGEDANV